MIGSLVLAAALAATLAAAPGPEPATAAAPPGADSRLDVPVTLILKDAAAVDLLEKTADLLGVAPILDPAIAGARVSLDLQNVPLSKALSEIERQAGVEIRVTERVLRARSTRPARSAASVPATLPRVGKGFGEVVRFWLDGGEERPVAVRVPDYVGRIELPGCSGLVTIARLGPYGAKAYGVALALPRATGEKTVARILDGATPDARKVLLLGCDGRLVADATEAAGAAAALEPARVEKGDPLVVTLRVLEVTEAGEESLSEPKIAFNPGAGWSVKSGFTDEENGGATMEVEVHGVPLEVRPEEQSVLLAVFAGVTRTVAPKDGGGTVAARRAESLWLARDRPVRWTVDSSWDGGRAAIVLEITLEKMGAAPR